MSASNQGCVGPHDMLHPDRFEELFGGPEVTFMPPTIWEPEEDWVDFAGVGVWDVDDLACVEGL